MSWDLEWAAPASRDMRHLEIATARRVREAVLRLAKSGEGDAVKLGGRKREWRLRVGDYRVLFTRDDAARLIVVLHVLPRGRAYRE